jgi:hypothetical protein
MNKTKPIFIDHSILKYLPMGSEIDIVSSPDISDIITGISLSDIDSDTIIYNPKENELLSDLDLEFSNFCLSWELLSSLLDNWFMKHSLLVLGFSGRDVWITEKIRIDKSNYPSKILRDSGYYSVCIPKDGHINTWPKGSGCLSETERFSIVSSISDVTSIRVPTDNEIMIFQERTECRKLPSEKG